MLTSPRLPSESLHHVKPSPVIVQYDEDGGKADAQGTEMGRFL